MISILLLISCILRNLVGSACFLCMIFSRMLISCSFITSVNEIGGSKSLWILILLDGEGEGAMEGTWLLACLAIPSALRLVGLRTMHDLDNSIVPSPMQCCF